MRESRFQCGKYCFRTTVPVEVGDVFRATNGHIGIITSVGTGDVPRVSLDRILVKNGPEVLKWLAAERTKDPRERKRLSSHRQYAYRRDLARQLAWNKAKRKG